MSHILTGSQCKCLAAASMRQTKVLESVNVFVAVQCEGYFSFEGEKYNHVKYCTVYVFVAVQCASYFSFDVCTCKVLSMFLLLYSV